ncbi:Uncharacterised protein [Serratia liquefaciens]|jgi:hypothetical protein|nr:Uncharacterised protein [Serratia liquefaciens]
MPARWNLATAGAYALKPLVFIRIVRPRDSSDKVCEVEK